MNIHTQDKQTLTLDFDGHTSPRGQWLLGANGEDISGLFLRCWPGADKLSLHAVSAKTGRVLNPSFDVPLLALLALAEELANPGSSLHRWLKESKNE